MGGRSSFLVDAMHFCYMDESGCTGALPSAATRVQPVLVIAGILVEESRVRDLTFDFLNLKQRFFPNKLPPSAEFLGWVLEEVKGNDVRKMARSNSHRERSHAYAFLDGFMALLEAHHIGVIGRVWAKGIGQPFHGVPVYTSSVQHICRYFSHFLDLNNSTGLIIADSRDPALNANVSHSIFTMKFRAAGDAFPRLLEMPTFGHSENHVGIQVADLLCSAFLFPMATCTYCLGHLTSPHVHASHVGLRRKFGAKGAQPAVHLLRGREDAGWDYRVRCHREEIGGGDVQALSRSPGMQPYEHTQRKSENTHRFPSRRRNLG